MRYTSANFATHKAPGRLESLKESVFSIINQVKRVRIYWNGYSVYDLPEWSNQMKIINYTGDDLTDNGKFRFIVDSLYDEDYFMCDDDIIYPPNYVAHTRPFLDAYPVISYHGRILNPHGNWENSYYRGGHQVLSYLNAVDTLTTVHVIGTGVSAFRTARLRPTLLYKSPYKRMSDLVFSEYCQTNRIPVVILPHPEAWLKHTTTRHQTTIATIESRGTQINQIDIVRKMLLRI